MKSLLIVCTASLSLAFGDCVCALFPDPVSYHAVASNGFGQSLSPTSGGDTLIQIAVSRNGLIQRGIGRMPRTWATVYRDTAKILNDVIYFPTPNAFGVVGSAGLFLYSSNNGITWINRSVSTTKTLYAVASSSGITYVAGDSGFIAWTLGYGTAWTIRPAATTARLTSVCIPRFDNALVCGTGGVIQHSSNYGNSWAVRNLGTTATFNKVYYAGLAGQGGKGWAAGDSGKMFRTTDNGATWQPLATGTTRSIRDIYFVEPLPSLSSALNDTGAIVGDGGLIRYTTNGGTTWRSDRGLDTLTNLSLSFISIVDSHTVAVGGNGILMYTSDRTLTTVGSRATGLPDRHALSQNLPNPFNPSTKIRFSIRSPLDRVQGSGASLTTRFVSLRVFDLLGREVATLVNEHLDAGEHERTLDARALPSGVYFYRLRVGEFTDVKKMVLAK